MNALVRRACAFVLVALAAGPAPAADGPGAPPAAEVKEAVDALRDVFEKDYAAADGDGKGKRGLARKLLDAAPNRKTPAMRYACLDEARRLAAAGGDPTLALDALAALTTAFPAAADALTADTLKALGSADLTPADAKPVVALAADRAAAALDREDYAGAVAFARLAAAVARKTEDPDLAVEARRALARGEALKGASDTLKAKPDDAAAHETLGRYWALARGRWDAGLKHLAKAADKDLAAAAALDLGGPKGAKERTAVADRWYKLAGAAGDDQRRFAERAAEWYSAALAVAAGDDDLKPAERLKDLEARFPGLFDVRFAGHTGPAAAVAVTPDGRTLVSAGNDHAVRVWDAASGRLRHTLTGHAAWVGSVVVTPDGARAVTAGGDNVIRVWELATGKELAQLTGHAVAVRGLALTADGKTLISGGGDRTVRAWDLAAGKELKRYGDGKHSVESVAVAPDGKLVLAGTDAGTVHVYDAKTGAAVSTFAGHAGTMVYAVAVTADGKTALSGARDKAVRVWDVATGKEVRALAGHAEQVYGLALSPDGKRVASASYDKTVRVWDLATGAEVAKLTGHADGVQGVCFGPDGRFVFSASWDKAVRKWHVPAAPAVVKKLD